MNIPVLIVALIMTTAVIAHIFFGTRDTASLEPVGKAGKPMANWVQTMGAFQMLSIDLIILTIALYFLGLYDQIPHASTLISALAVYFVLLGVLWFGHVLWLRREGATLLSVPHWAIWFLCAGLLWSGS